MATVEEAKQLIPELCKQFYDSGWVSGTGGGMSMRVGDRLVVAPSGVQKERMRPQDMFVLDIQGKVLEMPEARPLPYKPPKLSECFPLFQKAFEIRGAGAVLHSHSINAVLATLLSDSNEFQATQLEMIKGIAGHGYYSQCVVPIIENTARECELTESLEAAIRAYPDTSAVLVRRHGVYVWGRDWIHAKTQAECYEYLFTAAVKMRSLGVDVSKAPKSLGQPAEKGLANGHAPKRRKLAASPPPAAVVLDIEGTVAPLTLTKDVLFPYARAHLESHLKATWTTAETQSDVDKLAKEADEAGTSLRGSSMPDVQAVVQYVQKQMDADAKTTALKTLQGHIWREGYKAGQLKCTLFPDVLPALQGWSDRHIRTYIYSSGSRLAQRDLFAHTGDGDVRQHLSGYFDTTSGPKVQKDSYENIQLNLGVDSPADVLFATDILAEADAAAVAGWRVALVVRPGNKPLAAGHSHRVITSLADLLEA
ncbi:hypothetical protein WJX73_004540 [Symbiochloris irregularis]|uniref:Probable methylthioribulose-1-phosphate dehydratase n=1 Tax=Symbiochloris irregularis TaxID=706552 RepID=A0AAW1NWB1_9CHLO